MAPATMGNYSYRSQASGPTDAKRVSIWDGLYFDRFGHGEREPVLCSAMQMFQDGEITTAKS